MKSLPIQCSLCIWSGNFVDYEVGQSIYNQSNIYISFQTHLIENHPNPSCDFCGQKCNSISELDLHKLNDCDKVTVPCGLVNFGCSSQVNRKDMFQHYLTVEHQVAIMTFLRGDTPKIKTESNEGAASGMDVDMHSYMTTSTSASAYNDDIVQTIDVLHSGIQTLNGDVDRLGHEARYIESLIDVLSQDVATLKLSVDEQNKFLETLKPTQDTLGQEVNLLKTKMDDILTVSNEGVFIWKLTNFSQKMGN